MAAAAIHRRTDRGGEGSSPWLGKRARICTCLEMLLVRRSKCEGPHTSAARSNRQYLRPQRWRMPSRRTGDLPAKTPMGAKLQLFTAKAHARNEAVFRSPVLDGQGDLAGVGASGDGEGEGWAQ